MKRIYILVFLYLIIYPAYAKDAKVQQAIDWIMTSCVSSGSKVDITSNANAELRIKSLFKSGAGGEITFNKSEISGLTDELNKLSLENADKVRDCIAPFRGKILNLILGVSEKKESSAVDIIKTNNGDFSLNLEIYQEGDLAEEIGNNIVINKINNNKIIVGMNNKPGGKIEFEGFNLKGSFSLEIVTATDDASYILRSSDGDPKNDIVIKRSGHRIIFGETNKDAMSSGYKRKSNKVPNSFKIYAKSRAAKLYVNDNYFGTIKLSPQIEYGKMLIKGIGKNESVYGVNGFNL